MGATPEVVTLRTGKEVPSMMVNVTLISLNHLYETNGVALYELVMLARDSSHQLWGGTGDVLEGLGLTQGGRLHDITRDVVLAATEGEEMQMRLVDPVAV